MPACVHAHRRLPACLLPQALPQRGVWAATQAVCVCARDCVRVSVCLLCLVWVWGGIPGAQRPVIWTEEPVGTVAHSVSHFWITLQPAVSAGGTSLPLLLLCISPASLESPPDLLSCYWNNQERAVFPPGLLLPAGSFLTVPPLGDASLSTFCGSL